MTTSEERYRQNLVAHNRAVHELLEATTDRVRAFIQRSHLRHDLYPLEHLQELIANAEQLERESKIAAVTEIR